MLLIWVGLGAAGNQGLPESHLQKGFRCKQGPGLEGAGSSGGSGITWKSHVHADTECFRWENTVFQKCLDTTSSEEEGAWAH